MRRNVISQDFARVFRFQRFSGPLGAKQRTDHATDQHQSLLPSPGAAREGNSGST